MFVHMKTEYMLKLSDYGWLQKGGCTAPKNTKKKVAKKVSKFMFCTEYLMKTHNLFSTTKYCTDH